MFLLKWEKNFNKSFMDPWKQILEKTYKNTIKCQQMNFSDQSVSSHLRLRPHPDRGPGESSATYR